MQAIPGPASPMNVPHRFIARVPMHKYQGLRRRAPRGTRLRCKIAWMSCLAVALIKPDRGVR
jgi:hypothetical protein